MLNFYLGDNASFAFDNAVYIGMTAAIPVRIRNVAPTLEPIQLILQTSNMETISPQQTHVVSLDGFVIGQLTDTGSWSAEVHTITVPRELIREGQAQRINVEVIGRLPALEDDFVLRSLELVGAELHFGRA